MKKFYSLTILLLLMLVLTGCDEEATTLILESKVTTTFNITNNETVNITNYVNVTNNITTQFSGLINNTQLNTTNTGIAGQYPAYAGNGQFTWTTDQTGAGGGEVPTQWVYRERDVYFDADFLSPTTAYNDPWLFGAIGAGTSSAVAGKINHPGIIGLSASATASSGGNWAIAGLTTLVLRPNITTIGIINVSTKINGENTRGRFGFMDVIVGTDTVADGAYFNITMLNSSGVQNVTYIGTTRNNSVQSRTANFTTQSNQWLQLEVYIRNYSYVEYKIYNETGTLVFSDNTTGNVPFMFGRETTHALVFWVNGATGGVRVLAQVDYMAMGLNETTFTRFR